VIRPDRPWEGTMISLFLTVRDDGGRLRMWYICRDKANQANVAYAESHDGVAWVKPNLGIVNYAGSTDNNLVGLTSLEGVVFRDEQAPASERYVYLTHLWTEGMVRHYSPDGLHWQRDRAPLLRMGSDTQNVTFWDPRLGKYVVYLRGWRKEDKKIFRQVVRTELANLTTPLPVEPSPDARYLWGKDKMSVIGDELPAVFATDEHDPPNSDVYNIAAQPYPLDHRWYVGFPSLFQREKGTSDGRLEVHFVGSVDGIHWQRYDRRPYAPLGLAGSDCPNMTFLGTGMAVRGDEIWQYGTGFQTRHGDKERALRPAPDGVIFRYVQRVDGFVSLDFDNQEGSCVTGPVTIDGAQLLLNVDTGALGVLRVALLDEAGQELAGCGLEQCRPIRGNATGLAVAWKDGPELAPLAGRTVRLKLVGARTSLFSFRWE